MQELRSTDIIDKEIRADAIKKAEKIAKKADEDCKALIESLPAEIEKSRLEKKAFFDAKLEAFEKDQNASIPLEKQRFEVSFVQNKIVDAINNYLAAKSEAERIEIVIKNFDFNIDKKVNVFVYGFDITAVEKILSKKLGKNLLKCQETNFEKIVLEEDCGLAKPEGIILESEDKSYRCRLTMSQVINQILDKNRAELSDALFGGQQ